jgi:hypothetical protein
LSLYESIQFNIFIAVFELIDMFVVKWVRRQ